MSKTTSQGDQFVQIAGQASASSHSRRNEITPLSSPRLIIGNKDDLGSRFAPMECLDTPKKLTAALHRMREEYRPFLRRCAPVLESSRAAILLKQWQWRLLGEGETRNPASWANDATAWTEVELPHFGGPVGPATTVYRRLLPVEAEPEAGRAWWIVFRGADYKARVFVNGLFAGEHEGFFAPFEFDISTLLRRGENEVVVELENDAPQLGVKVDGETMEGDKVYAATGPGWDEPGVGWHHCPPGMGLYQMVSIENRPVLHIKDVWVRPLVNERAAAVKVEVFNPGRKPVEADFSISIFGENFEETVVEGQLFGSEPAVNRSVSFYSFRVELPDMRLWELSSPWLYQAQVTMVDRRTKQKMDSASSVFGMRSFRMELEQKPYGRLYLNDKPIRLFGANTMGFEQQAVMKGDIDQVIDDVLLAKLTGMNFLRFTQRPVQSEIYDICDRLGLMNQTDLPLFGRMRKNHYIEVLRQTREMERLVRSHPSTVITTLINERFGAEHIKGNLDLVRAEIEAFFVAAQQIVKIENPDRVLKPVDGDYDAPAPGLPDNHCYNGWYNGHEIDWGHMLRGYWIRQPEDWCYGCGEFGAEGLDYPDLMYRRYPKDWLPTLDEPASAWSPNRIVRAQTGLLHGFFFPAQNSLEDWVKEGQRHQAETLRWMVESFRRQDRMISFAVHLFIDAFPAGWMKAIVDCERKPKPAYFAYRHALAPIAIGIRPNRFHYFAGENLTADLWIANDTDANSVDWTIQYQLEIDGEITFSSRTAAELQSHRPTCQGTLQLQLPGLRKRGQALLRARLVDNTGKPIHETTLQVDIHPQLKLSTTPITLHRPGGTDDTTRAFDRAAGLHEVEDLATANAIWITDYDQLESRREKISQAVSQGAVCMVGPFEKGIYTIEKSEITIRNIEMGPVQFVAPDRSHSATAAFADLDFRWWYNPAKDQIDPLCNCSIESDQLKPVLLTLNKPDGSSFMTGDYSQKIACGELKHGRGSYLITQIPFHLFPTEPTPISFILALCTHKSKSKKTVQHDSYKAVNVPAF